MKIIKQDLESAATKGILSPAQATALWQYLTTERAQTPQHQTLHVLYYFGGLLILSSMSWFLTKAWNDGLAIMEISAIFGLIYLITGHLLWKKPNLKIPAGLLITAAVGLTPLFIFGYQMHAGHWAEMTNTNYQDFHRLIKPTWLLMEVGTIITASAALYFYTFPFITFPLSVALWYMSMDLTPYLFGKNDFNWDERKYVSCVFGLIMLAVAYTVDRKNKSKDFAFWLYLYGMCAFWGGLTAMESTSEVGKAIYALLNVIFIFASVYFRRKIFIVFGVIGVMIYLSHLAYEIFKDSYGFPIVLAIAGLAILFLGVKYQKNRERFEAAVEKTLPTFLMKWRPAERA